MWSEVLLSSFDRPRCRYALIQVKLALADIEELKWVPLLFNNLTTPQQRKGILLALTETRTGQHQGPTFDDLVMGKR